MQIYKIISVLGIFLAMCSCNEKLEQEIVSTWPNGEPMKLLYYESVKGLREKVREERFYENGNKEMVGGFQGIKKDFFIIAVI